MKLIIFAVFPCVLWFINSCIKLHKEVLTVESVDKILKCDRSKHETY